MKELDWRPIDSAPRDTPILAWCEHSADPYWEEDGMALTTYGCHCEGLTRVSDGINLVIWGGDLEVHTDKITHGPDRVQVCCNTCLTCGPIDDTEIGARIEWNRRKPL